jgi:hypothetical protein
VSLATDIQAQDSKPEQLGGIDLSADDATTIANKIGLNGVTVAADGAGAGGRCEIAQPDGGSGSGSKAVVRCASDDAQTAVKATYDPDSDPEVSTTAGTSISVASL